MTGLNFKPTATSMRFSYLVILAVFVAPVAQALPEMIPDKGKTQGWTKTASLGANLSFTSNENVIGSNRRAESNLWDQSQELI